MQNLRVNENDKQGWKNCRFFLEEGFRGKFQKKIAY